MSNRNLWKASFIFGLPVLVAALFGFAGTVHATKTKLTLQNAPLTILKDSSTTKGINGIPDGTPGMISLRIKWHVMTFIPNVFNKLKIEMMHGSTVLETKECYSTHSDKEPKCYVSQLVDAAEANRTGDWKLRVTNNTQHDVNGFNIEKEITDLNPTVMFVESTFEPSCSSRTLSLQGGEVEIGPYSSVERELYGIESRGGEIRLKAKWHIDVITPNVFNPLTVELLRDGTVVKTDFGYSIHSDNKDKFALTHSFGASARSTWKLRVSNKQGLKAKGFDIEKGRDSNPFVPQFGSTFKPGCS